MMDGVGWKYVVEEKNIEETNKSFEYILNFCMERGIRINADFDLKQKASYALSKLAFKYTQEYLDNETPKNCDFIIFDFYLLPYLNEFCDSDYNILLDVDAATRYNRALIRMSKNVGKKFDEEEKAFRIKKMAEFEEKENVNYQLINYDLVLRNLSGLEDLQKNARV